jgi:hypothetical protein
LLQGDCSSPHPESKPQTSCSHCFTYRNLSHPNLRWHKLFKILWTLVGLLLNSKSLYPQKVQRMHKQMWTHKKKIKTITTVVMKWKSSAKRVSSITNQLAMKVH